MTYIDVVEFNSEHIGDAYSYAYERFAPKLKGKLGKTSSNMTFAFVAVYLQFYYYFVLKQLLQAKKIFGEKTDSEVIKDIITLFTEGIR